MKPKGRPRGPWNYKLVTIFLSLSGHFVLVLLRILQVLETTMSRYGETCILNRYRSPYAHQKITIHVLDLAQNQEVVVEVEREAEEEIAII